MANLKDINSSPAFTEYIVALRTFTLKPLIVLDVGARGGFENHWSIYRDQVKLIGFEANTEECERLNRQIPASPDRFFPYALHRDKGKKPFYVTAHAPSSGFYPVDQRFTKRLDGDTLFTINATVEIDTIDLDSLNASQNFGPIDFIKLDTEGNELDVLEGAINCLKKSVIGLSVEVEFFPIHNNQPVFSDVDPFLRRIGFRLYHLTNYRLSRKVLPAITKAPVPGPAERGQTIFGQALYLRDGVAELEYGNIMGDVWDDIKILKLASIMDLFSLPDCAIELIQTAQKKGLLQDAEAEKYMDLIVSSAGEGDTSYAKYLEKVRLAKLPKPVIVSSTSGDARQPIARLLPGPLRRVIRRSLIKCRDFINLLVDG